MNDDIISLLGWHGPDVVHLTMHPGDQSFLGTATHHEGHKHYLYELTGPADLIHVAKMVNMAHRYPVDNPTCTMYVHDAPFRVVTILRASWMKVSNDEAIVRFVMRSSRSVRLRIGEHRGPSGRVEVYGMYVGTSVFYLDGWSFRQMKEVEEV